MKELKEQLQYAITHSEEPEKARSYLKAINDLEEKIAKILNYCDEFRECTPRLVEIKKIIEGDETDGKND